MQQVRTISRVQIGELAALYAFAQAKAKDIVCFAHITNQMAQIEGDFEKGLDQGSHDALRIISLTAHRVFSPTLSCFRFADGAIGAGN